MVNGHADFMNVFVFNVVIVPLVALMADWLRGGTALTQTA
jgi:hypothetical protein